MQSGKVVTLALGFWLAAVAGGLARPSNSTHGRASAFSGRCELSGRVVFSPALSNATRPIDQRARASGPCSGTFVDRHGATHELAGEPATYVAAERADAASCAAGADAGRGRLEFRYGTIAFRISEVRAAAGVAARVTGTRGGSAAGIGVASPSNDPVAIAQACAGPGLEQVDITIEAITTPALRG